MPRRRALAALSIVGRLTVLAVTAAALTVLVYFALFLASAYQPDPRGEALLWVLPGLLGLAGAAWPVQRGVTYAAILAVCSGAASLVMYWGMWTLQCPACSQGDWSRAAAFSGMWPFYGLLAVVGVLIVAVAAIASSAFVVTIRPAATND